MGIAINAADGKPMQLADVLIKGTQNSIVTNQMDSYSLRKPGPKAVLLPFYTGSQKQDMVKNTQSVTYVTLAEATEGILLGCSGNRRSGDEGEFGRVAGGHLSKSDGVPSSNISSALARQHQAYRIEWDSTNPASGRLP